MIEIKTLVGKGCRCCDDIRPKLEKICGERGWKYEVTDLGNIDEIPSDLTGVPYTIIVRDGMYVTSFQGDSPEDILEKRIDTLLNKHTSIINKSING